MIRSAKQRRFLEATEAQRGYTPGSSPSLGQSMTPALTMPGGAVQSGGYVENTKFKRPSMPRIRKGGL